MANVLIIEVTSHSLEEIEEDHVKEAQDEEEAEVEIGYQVIN